MYLCSSIAPISCTGACRGSVGENGTPTSTTQQGVRTGPLGTRGGRGIVYGLGGWRLLAHCATHTVHHLATPASTSETIAWNPHSLTVYGLTHPRGRWINWGSKYSFLSIYANSAMTAVSLSGSFLSTLLFKLKNVPGDAVSAYLKYPSLVNPLTVLLSPRRGSCWAKSAVIKSTT